MLAKILQPRICISTCFLYISLIFSKMFDKPNEVLGKVLLVLLTILFTFNSRFTSFVRSFVSTRMIIEPGFLSSASSIFLKCMCWLPQENSVHQLFFVFENPQWLILLSMVSPINTNLFDESSFSSWISLSLALSRKFKNTGIPSIKIPLNMVRRNHYLDFRYTLTIMIPELMPQAICCKKPF